MVFTVEANDGLALVRRLEATLPTLEEAGCKVGIGVATGADEAFIGPMDELDVEDDRKLPLVMTRDILSGKIERRGKGIVNPIAAVLSVAMMLKYSLCEPELAAAVDQATKNAIEKGITTKDIGGTSSTSEVGDAIAKELEAILKQ